MASQYIVHTVGAGDTIQAIGLLYGVDWTELVTINGLEYPYIDDDLYINENESLDGVAKIGSKLVIPTPGINIPHKINNSSEDIEKYAYGCDLDLFSLEETENHIVNLEVEGQLTDNNKGDIKLSEGIDNLRQQLVIRIGTPKGALLLHPEFGSNINQYIGKRTTVELLTKVKLDVQECILGDFRVLGVSDMSAIGKNRGIYIECFVHPTEPYSTPFRLSHTFTD